MIEHGLFLFAAYVAAVIATVAGFGSSTVLVPVAMFFMDLKTAVFLVACFHLFNNLFKIRLFFKKIDFKLFRLFGIPSIIFAFLGAQCIAVLPVEILKRVVAAFLILFAGISFIKPHVKIGKNPVNAVVGGSLSGFLAGLIGMGGAIRSMFLLSFNLPKEIYVGTAAMIAFVIDVTRIPTYLWMGVVRNHVYYSLLPLLVVIAYLGVRTGKALLGKIDQAVFRKIVLGALFLVGLKLLFS
jgi:uncharacterized membrane protein YfcA